MAITDTKGEYECRFTGNKDGELILDLGKQPLANNYLSESDLSSEEPRFPLRLMVSPSSWLVQITDILPPVDLFSEYMYFSSYSTTMLEHSKKAVETYIKDYGLGEDSFIVEIASNDGYLLKNFVEHKVPCLGIEPAENIAEVARNNGVPTQSEFFTQESAIKLREEKSSADLILGNNVFAHAPNVNDFVAGLGELLAEDGRIILEFPYLSDMIEHCEFDTIYHEHVYYFSMHALDQIFKKHNLFVYDVQRLKIHGGSLRLFVCHEGANSRSNAVDQILKDEAEIGVNSMDYYRGFQSRVTNLLAELADLLKKLKSEGKTIAVYGASAKGSTLLNCLDVNPTDLEFIADRNPHKCGKLSPGLHLPIIDADELKERNPDYVLLLTWNFADEILKQQQEYRDGGGKFIIPIPEVKVI